MVGKFLVLMMGIVLMNRTEKAVLFNFEDPQTFGAWWIVNDGVMGGLSQSDMDVQNGAATFKGTVSLENYGGFASVRAPIPDIDLSGRSGFQIRVRGDGKRYKFRIRTNNSFDGVAYSANFQTKLAQWQTIRLDKSDFVPVYRGRIVRGAPDLDLNDVRQVGFLISDKQDGPFQLNIQSVEVF